MEIALSVNAKIVGINNRDLKTFKTDLNTPQRIIKSFFLDQKNETPILVSESGIFTHSDMVMLGECGVDSVLIGEALMKETDIEAKLRELVG
jgi:indole-3-glycerol phosphate synthase